MTVRDTLTRAGRMTMGRAINEVMTAAEMAAMLEIFQQMLMALPRVTLVDVLISADYTAGENERVFNSTGAPVTITLPETVIDPRTGIERPPHNGAVVEVAGSAAERHIYIGELGAWQKVSGLDLTSEQPFGPEHEAGLAAMLAARASGEVFQKQADPVTLQLAEQGRRTIRQRFNQPYFAITDPLLLNTRQRMALNP